LDGGWNGGFADEHEASVLPLEDAALAEISDRLSDEIGVAACPVGEELRELLR
jgi:hypothetical protein